MTRDGGETWTEKGSGLSEDFHDVEVVSSPERDETVVWITGRSGTVVSTRNAGESWIQQRSGTSSRLSGVHFDENMHFYGWAVGHNGTILVTADGGSRWHSIGGVSTSNLLAVRMSRGNTKGWAVGVDGTIVRIENVDVGSLHGQTDEAFVQSAEKLIAEADLEGISFVEESMERVKGTEAELERNLREMDDKKSTIVNMQTSLFLSNARNFETDVEMEEGVNMLKFMENVTPNVAIAILNSRNEAEDRTILTTNLTRLGVVGFFIYMIALLINVYRYDMRLAAFYDARADAISLGDPRGAKWVELVEKLAPDGIQYGKNARISMEEGVGWIDRMFRITRRQ